MEEVSSCLAMLTYAKLSKTPTKFQRFTGLTVEEFDQLAAEVEPLWQASERSRLTSRTRQRVVGGGGQYKLESFQDKLLVPLMYYRLYVTYELLSWIFQLDVSNLNRLVHRLEPVLAKHLNPHPPTPLKHRIRNWEEFQKAYPDLTEVVIDGTEQGTQHPRGQKRQKPYYSQKRKRHTIKTQIVVTKSGRVLWVSDSVPGGRVHDYPLLKRSRVMERLPEAVIKRVDLGYQGIKTDYPDHAVVIPKKKPCNQELTPVQKRQNRKKAKQRIVVEHTLAHLKQFQVLSQTYRNRRGKNNQSYNRKIRIVAGLVNLRYESRTA
jgi:hypothetical protein